MAAIVILVGLMTGGHLFGRGFGEKSVHIRIKVSHFLIENPNDRVLNKVACFSLT